MKYMFKKLFILIVAAWLAACGGSKSSDNTASQAANLTSSDTAGGTDDQSGSGAEDPIEDVGINMPPGEEIYEGQPDVVSNPAQQNGLPAAGDTACKAVNAEKSFATFVDPSANIRTVAQFGDQFFIANSAKYGTANEPPLGRIHVWRPNGGSSILQNYYPTGRARYSDLKSPSFCFDTMSVLDGGFMGLSQNICGVASEYFSVSGDRFQLFHMKSSGPVWLGGISNLDAKSIVTKMNSINIAGTNGSSTVKVTKLEINTKREATANFDAEGGYWLPATNFYTVPEDLQIASSDYKRAAGVNVLPYNEGNNIYVLALYKKAGSKKDHRLIVLDGMKEGVIVSASESVTLHNLYNNPSMKLMMKNGKAYAIGQNDFIFFDHAAVKTKHYNIGSGDYIFSKYDTPEMNTVLGGQLMTCAYTKDSFNRKYVVVSINPESGNIQELLSIPHDAYSYDNWGMKSYKIGNNEGLALWVNNGLKLFPKNTCK